MATVHFRQAKILIDGAELSASFNDGPNVEYSCETLDETAHGDDTRVHKSGLFNAMIGGGGHCEFGDNAIEDIVFNRVGTNDTVLCVFPDGITEGTTTNKGYAMLGCIDEFTIGGAVGTLLPFTFHAYSRGLAE